MACKFPLKYWKYHPNGKLPTEDEALVVVRIPNQPHDFQVDVQHRMNLADPGWAPWDSWYTEITHAEATEILGYEPDVQVIRRKAEYLDGKSSND